MSRKRTCRFLWASLLTSVVAAFVWDPSSSLAAEDASVSGNEAAAVEIRDIDAGAREMLVALAESDRALLRSDQEGAAEAISRACQLMDAIDRRAAGAGEDERAASPARLGRIRIGIDHEDVRDAAQLLRPYRPRGSTGLQMNLARLAPTLRRFCAEPGELSSASIFLAASSSIRYVSDAPAPVAKEDRQSKPAETEDEHEAQPS